MKNKHIQAFLKRGVECKASEKGSLSFIPLALIFSAFILGVVRSPIWHRYQYTRKVSKMPSLPSLDEDVHVPEELNPCDVLIDALECNPQICLWSAKLQKNVDFEYQPMLFRSEGGPCTFPQGGQTAPPNPDMNNTISYILTYSLPKSFVKKCILKIFLDARYTEGAELIIVDDSSHEEDQQIKLLLWLLEAAFGFKIIFLKNRGNLGFGASNNKAIQRASGRFLAIVNSDAMLQPGWSRVTLETFRLHRNIGYLGSHLIGDQNKITDGGGIIWADGRPEIIGRGLSDLPPHLSYLRPVDYASAAAVLVRKDVFNLVNGLDSKYGKGYFEDTDLCMKIRKAGYVVAFQPMAIVYHQEGSSLGTDGSELKDELMESGIQVFKQSWKKILSSNHCSKKDGYREFHRHRNYNVLLIDSQLPEPDRDSGSIRLDYMIQSMIELGVQIHFKPLEGIKRKYKQRLAFLGVNVLDVSLNAILGTKCRFDAVIVAHRDTFIKSLPYLAKKDCLRVTIFDTVDLHFLREMRTAVNKGSWGFTNNSTAFDALKLIQKIRSSGEIEDDLLTMKMRQELGLLRLSAANIFVSNVEVEVVRTLVPQIKHNALISNLYDFRRKKWGTQTFRKRRGLIFVGNMNHPPNQEAVLTLLKDVLPSFFHRYKDFSRSEMPIHIVGSNIIPDHIERLFYLNKEQIFVHRNLSPNALERLYASVRVSVAPLLSGAGVKGKVAEAILHGVPVVGTPLALEAMGFQDKKHVLVASSPEMFANQLHKISTDERLWYELRGNAWSKLKDNFDVEGAKSRLQKLFSEVIPEFQGDMVDPRCH